MRYASIKNYCLAVSLPGGDCYELPDVAVPYTVEFDGLVCDAAGLKALVAALAIYRQEGKLPVVAIFLPTERRGG